MNREGILHSRGFSYDEKKFYNSKGKLNTDSYENFFDEIKGWFRHEGTRMGGNYGPGDFYLVVTEDEVKKMQYYGDSSASFILVGKYENDFQLQELLTNAYK